jgi:hypothetical protein
VVDMKDKKMLKIDFNDLCDSMENSSYENKYYLDLDSGEILFVLDYSDDEDNIKVKRQIKKNPRRYEPIPQVESYEGYEDMEDFIITVEDEHLAELLEVAVNGKGAFRRFKDVLLNYPEERERWFKFKDEKMERRAREWLEDIGVTLIEE